jgi:protein TonB
MAVTAPLNSQAVQSSAPDSTPTANVNSTSAVKSVSPRAEANGGLLVTENGRVIYRESASQLSAGDSAPTTARIVHRVDPEYPVEARNRNIHGAVVLDVQVLTDGTVGTIGIVSGDPLLTESAVHAVRQWKYQPNIVNGRPIEGQTRIKINFTLPPAN